MFEVLVVGLEAAVICLGATVLFKVVCWLDKEAD